ncbi:lipopolysaccharide biosynthesis protein [Chitinophaga solisilvae]|uniref:lipopolysaccharide biosynthesis protein n=1 Tax=Chitinophaga solisilvae TaxID=1233460 RepID=UPI001371F89D|nr:lipopolysaccharide biosynthesis protein [Chitinophaga solisilvae]
MDSYKNSPDADKFRSNEISVKDLVLRFYDWCGYLWKKKLIILIAAAAGLGLGCYIVTVLKPKYEGKLTFVLQENSQGGMGAYAGIASQFGLDLSGGSSGAGVFTNDNIMEFLTSRLMVESTLLSPVTLNNKAMTLMNHFLDFSGNRKRMAKNKTLEHIDFPLNADRGKFSLQQDSILNEAYKVITKKLLKVEKKDKNLDFISVTCSSEDEIFSKVFIESLVEKASAFYIDTKTKRTKGSVDRLQLQADSMEILLNRKTYASAEVQDLNQNPARRIASVKTELLTRDKMMLQTMYGEIVKNLELSKITMAQETPVIQVVDKPIFPLEKKEWGFAKGGILGAIVGGFLACIIICIRKLYKDIMK